MTWNASSHDLSGLRRRLGQRRRSVEMDFSLRTDLPVTLEDL